MKRLDVCPRHSRQGDIAVAAASFLAVLGMFVLLSLLLPQRHCTVGQHLKTSKASSDISTIVHYLSEYAIDHDGKYPNTLQPLFALDAEGHCYIEGFDGHILRDPWKRGYIYLPPTPEHPSPRVISLGKDGEPGGEGDDADIDSDQLKDE